MMDVIGLTYSERPTIWEQGMYLILHASITGFDHGRMRSLLLSQAKILPDGIFFTRIKGK
jgi:hypothetical protein